MNHDLPGTGWSRERRLVASGISRMALPSNQCPRSEPQRRDSARCRWDPVASQSFWQSRSRPHLFFWQSSGKCLVLEDVHPCEPKKVWVTWVTCLDPHFWLTEAGSLGSGTAKVKKSLKASHPTTEQSSRVLSFWVMRVCVNCSCQCVCVCVCFFVQNYLNWLRKTEIKTGTRKEMRDWNFDRWGRWNG